MRCVKKHRKRLGLKDKNNRSFELDIAYENKRGNRFYNRYIPPKNDE